MLIFRSFDPVVIGLISFDSFLIPPVLGRVFPEDAPPDNGLGGRLDMPIPLRGGCGNALILTLFLSVFPAEFTPGVVRILGSVVLVLRVVGG